MKRYQKVLLLTICLLVCIGTVSYFIWKPGTPFSSPYWSPNKQYYVQKYSNLSFSSFIPVMPGQGSDLINGYIRVFDKDGKLLNERFVYVIRDVEPIWEGNKVYLKGIADMEEVIWILPTSGE